ncbi:MAG: Ig-like domain-containing protein [Deltaproteobacteria bacterium]|nr:Ig-like domain-containing protein [Deltaproteobacteria bacterium]
MNGIRRHPSPLTALALVAFVAGIALWAGCGDETAVDLHFQVNADIVDEASLAKKLGHLEIVIDAPQGLYPKGEERLDDPNLVIRDVDLDGWPEVVATVDLDATLGHLPVVRIDRGTLDVSVIEVRVSGVAADKSPSEKIASGGLRQARFLSGEIHEVTLPFNLRPAYRPPYVAAVYPSDGATDVSAKAGSVLLVFSKPMALDSLKAANVIQLLQVVGDVETPVPASRIALREQYAGGPTMAEYHLADPLKDATLYRVRVTLGAHDVSGRVLDQRGQEPGSQPFASQFTTEGPVGTQVTPALAMERWCEKGGGSCPNGLGCDEKTGACMPAVCPATCPPATVCDPTKKACVSDCRVYGGYGGCPDGVTCGADGLCVTPGA